MTVAKLKPCPWCGGALQEARVVEGDTFRWRKLQGCCTDGPEVHIDTLADDRVAAEERAAQAAIDAWNTRAPQWQPIESAPKGQEVLVWRPDQGVFIAMIATPDMVMSERDIEECCLPEDFEEWYCEAWGWLEDDLRPTRWMPKPAEPEVEA
ncbi:TPA: hypothetical protein ACGCHH_000325 [Stenotrophomonas maltophilia]